MDWAGQVSAISSIISATASCLAFGSVLIALLAFRENTRENRKRDFHTIAMSVNEKAAMVDQAVKRKMDLERKIGLVSNPFSYQHISANSDIEKEVFSILNHYEHICFMANSGIFPYKYWEPARGDIFIERIQQYKPYIEEYIAATQQKSAWSECLKLYRSFLGN